MDSEFAESITPLIAFWDKTDLYTPYEKCTPKNPKSCTFSLKQGTASTKVDKSKKIVNAKFTQTTEFPLWSTEIDETVKTNGNWTFDLDFAPKKNSGWEIVDHDIDSAFDALEPVIL